MIRTALGIVKAGLLKKPTPIYCHWEFTFRCNLTCEFCTLQSGSNIWTPETTTGQAADIVRQLHSLGTTIIHFVGGEPTLRKDLGKIASLARSKGVMTAVTSNGFVRESDLSALKEMQFIRISLTGPYDRNKVLGESSPRLDPVLTLQRLVELGAQPEIATTVSALSTPEDLEYVFDTAQKLGLKVGLNFVGIGVSNLRGFGPEDLRQRTEELSSLYMDKSRALSKLRQLLKTHAGTVQDNSDFLDMVEQGGLDAYGCRAMDAAICLKADGSVAMPCIEFPHMTPKGTLADVFHGQDAQEARRNQGKYWFCRECTLSCMYSASRLLRLSSLPDMAKHYFKSVRLK